MKLIVSPLAAQRLAEIGAYIAKHNPSAAPRVEAAIRSTLSLLTDHAMAGKRVRSNLRRFVVPRLPYIVLYRVDEQAKTVTVATIRHAAQRPL